MALTEEGLVARSGCTPRSLTTTCSAPVAADAGTVAYLRQAGCTRVDHLSLPELGIRGNGHLMMLERNNEQVLDVVTDWLAKNTSTD